MGGGLESRCGAVCGAHGAVHGAENRMLQLNI